ncbi:MAG: sigma 54-interacting transcriptional regulator [candidate division KSB1 bacterium]|nr:sigma 54-interacting transcriptional regulator [candidate division KSB1 bacterium]MDZ7303065.1 sigma 54-interacting transcriptional regulator [candidate division KSB1 bacterium]MDZ7314397.1 sigma 54-interacting transcriptional regulator [candidate division KSB1 bacterium]
MSTVIGQQINSNGVSVLDALMRISHTINTLQEFDVLLEKIMDIAVETVGAERGFIILSSESGTLSVKTARNISDQNIQNLANYSNSVVRMVLQTGETLLSYDAQGDERFRDMHSIVMKQIQAIACVPLKIKERPIGAIYLDSISRRSGFTETSLPFLKTFANQAAIAIENAQLYQQLREENRQLRKEAQRVSGFADIIGQSARMRQVFDVINSVLDSDATVLIQGESGTGKELVARAIHHHGLRKEKPFIALFCGSLPESLLESELFGHKKGAFTGAVSDKRGLFEAADTGTFFLDEIGDISPKLQTQLLRVLQEGEIKRVGENHVRHVDVRIIAATNKNLQEKIKEGTFREDLYYRLDVINIYLPALRERAEDIPLLAQHFLKKFASRYKKNILGFSSEATYLMSRYHWPGNVRELENTIERAVVLAKGALIGVEDLRIAETNGHWSLPSGMTLEQLSRRLVEQTLKETGGNITQTAARLGVSRRWIQYKQKQWYDATN